jgi:hypothetical protein
MSHLLAGQEIFKPGMRVLWARFPCLGERQNTRPSPNTWLEDLAKELWRICRSKLPKSTF